MTLARPELAATLVQLRRRVDAHFDAALARSPAAFRCGPGCESCCHVRIGVFAVEAAAIRDALARLGDRDPALRARLRVQADAPDHADRCALLVDGRCAVYDDRPLICRSHGLPIAAADPHDPAASLRLDHCPLNFRDEPPPRASILRLDAVNQPLAVLASLWDADTTHAARSPADAPRIDLADLARVSP
ncbi:YkgJ family cysteine cluster protein [Nannocystis sp.]|uniref:YkgJ family cysteine cluster protein n=1 Tax=Nannocystis sp. TaxID=1962667 RepID=UPI0025D393E6|nr:YkgJ family cysteine cluster protein [Nannocystis sp.]MBK7824351.1 YkgJ family cysteine cluster protein [Nannocystis sp.]